jgi:hypothetical protein
MTLTLRIPAGAGWLLAATLVWFGCGSSTTGNDTTGTATDAGVCISAAGAAGAASLCQAADDLAWLRSQATPAQTGRELARAEASNCGLACLNDACPDDCAVRCMTQVKGVQLSSGCAGCYGGIVLCTIGKCLPQCINEPQSTGCKECQETQGCNDEFYGCTGPLD